MAGFFSQLTAEAVVCVILLGGSVGVAVMASP
jgi:hypothetical protein